jgi:hypothetical protein
MSVYHRFTLGNVPPSNGFSLEKEVNPIISKYYPNLLDATHAALAVMATLALKDRTRPLSLIFECPSGNGKTAVLQMFFPPPITTKCSDETKRLNKEISKYVYRSDKFTPKSFVSHAANIKKEDLEKVDLLPKIVNKVLISKELAPIFRGRDDDLKENFSILISVLDGQGLTTDTGMRGQRGYVGKYIFNWIGATTPIPASTHKLMSQLGTRIVFYELAVSEPTMEQLIAYAERGDIGQAEEDCRNVVNTFMLKFFTNNPVGSIETKDIHIPNEHIRHIVRWSQFLVKARSEIKYEAEYGYDEPIAAEEPEGVWKVINYLKELAIGHALIHGRREVNESDINLIAHVAISSVPIQLRSIIKLLRTTDLLTSSEGAKLCKCSPPTIRKRFKELEVLGIVDLTNGVSKTSTPDTIKLLDVYSWLKL